MSLALAATYPRDRSAPLAGLFHQIAISWGRTPPLRKGEHRNARLLQRGIDRRKLGVEVRTQAVHHGNDRERDARCDQAIFDRGRPRFIRQKLQKVMLQRRLRRNCAEFCSAPYTYGKEPKVA
jgi:hypothetical protein